MGWLPAGRIFVGDEQAHTIHVFSPAGEFLQSAGREGVWLGTVETPTGLEVHQIGEDRLIGVAKHEYDVPYVQVHRLRR